VPTERVPGIDVSRFQRNIKWDAVALDGIQFAFVQASRGSGSDCTVKPDECGPDGYYASNYADAKDFGIRVGPYHRAFVGGNGPTQVKRDARAEARIFGNTVSELGGTDLRPALDMETPFANLNPFELRLWTRTWLRSVKRRLHVKPIIYTNVTSWNALGNPTWFAEHGYPLWVANWDVLTPAVPAGNWAGIGWRIWQHSSTGSVDGIKGNVDLDWLRFGWDGISVNDEPIPNRH
jgi:GH25 family lysozyme M1 (1,4-beta-N-acetylmuramidase)